MSQICNLLGTVIRSGSGKQQLRTVDQQPFSSDHFLRGFLGSKEMGSESGNYDALGFVYCTSTSISDLNISTWSKEVMEILYSVDKHTSSVARFLDVFDKISLLGVLSYDVSHSASISISRSCKDKLSLTQALLIKSLSKAGILNAHYPREMDIKKQGEVLSYTIGSSMLLSMSRVYVPFLRSLIWWLDDSRSSDIRVMMESALNHQNPIISALIGIRESGFHAKGLNSHLGYVDVADQARFTEIASGTFSFRTSSNGSLRRFLGSLVGGISDHDLDVLTRQMCCVLPMTPWWFQSIVTFFGNRQRFFRHPLGSTLTKLGITLVRKIADDPVAAFDHYYFAGNAGILKDRKRLQSTLIRVAKACDLSLREFNSKHLYDCFISATRNQSGALASENHSIGSYTYLLSPDLFSSLKNIPVIQSYQTKELEVQKQTVLELSSFNTGFTLNMWVGRAPSDGVIVRDQVVRPSGLRPVALDETPGEVSRNETSRDTSLSTADCDFGLLFY